MAILGNHHVQVDSINLKPGSLGLKLSYRRTWNIFIMCQTVNWMGSSHTFFPPPTPFTSCLPFISSIHSENSLLLQSPAGQLVHFKADKEVCSAPHTSSCSIGGIPELNCTSTPVDIEVQYILVKIPASDGLPKTAIFTFVGK